MGYRISVHRKAGRFIESQTPEVRQRLWDRINQLRDNPHPPGCLKLTDFKPDGWRIRVGKYRVLYQILDKELLVWVFQIDLRDDAYSR
jgi:mRNA interferase RelE/StbE